MFWKRKTRIAARVGTWKWVDMEGKAGGLFNLELDAGENNDLSSIHPEKLQQLKDRYQTWLEAMNASSPRGPFRDF
jgi:hypothetical protein